VVPHTDFSSREEFEAAVHGHIEKAGAELVCLAGFMR
jgi:folate-dependent phosphoribosylglycinamide formyltransferase PurN